ncbi:MAG TPA: hypothetical protein VIG30_18340 [Ktedonobacterales bacterium]
MGRGGRRGTARCGIFRYKNFDSAACGDNMEHLETAINEWMRQQHPRIRQMAQSARGSHVLVSFVYEENSDSPPQLARKAAVPEVYERALEESDLDPRDEDDAGLPEAELPY